MLSCYGEMLAEKLECSEFTSCSPCLLQLLPSKMLTFNLMPAALSPSATISSCFFNVFVWLQESTGKPTASAASAVPALISACMAVHDAAVSFAFESCTLWSCALTVSPTSAKVTAHHMHAWSVHLVQAGNHLSPKIGFSDMPLSSARFMISAFVRNSSPFLCACNRQECRNFFY